MRTHSFTALTHGRRSHARTHGHRTRTRTHARRGGRVEHVGRYEWHTVCASARALVPLLFPVASTLAHRHTHKRVRAHARARGGHTHTHTRSSGVFHRGNSVAVVVDSGSDNRGMVPPTPTPQPSSACARTTRTIGGMRRVYRTVQSDFNTRTTYDFTTLTRALPPPTLFECPSINRSTKQITNKSKCAFVFFFFYFNHLLNVCKQPCVI